MGERSGHGQGILIDVLYMNHVLIATKFENKALTIKQREQLMEGFDAVSFGELGPYSPAVLEILTRGPSSIEPPSDSLIEHQSHNFRIINTLSRGNEILFIPFDHYLPFLLLAKEIAFEHLSRESTKIYSFS